MSDSVWPHRRQPTRFFCPWDSPGKNTGVGCHFLLQCMKVKSEREVAQSCPTLSDPMNCSLPGSSIHGIFQARVLEWGAIAFSNCSHSWMQKTENVTDTIGWGQIWSHPCKTHFHLGHKSLFYWFLFHHALLSPHSHSCQVLGFGCHFSLLLGHKEHLWKAEGCIILFRWHTAFYRVPKPTLKWFCISSSGTEREWPNQVSSSRVGHQLK